MNIKHISWVNISMKNAIVTKWMLITEELRTKTNQIVTSMSNLKSMKAKECQWLQEADTFRETLQSQASDIQRLRTENDEVKVSEILIEVVQFREVSLYTEKLSMHFLPCLN